MDAKPLDLRLSEESVRVMRANAEAMSRSMENLSAALGRMQAQVAASLNAWANANRPMIAALVELDARWVSSQSEADALRATFPPGTRLRVVLGRPPRFTLVDADLTDPPVDTFREWCWRCDATQSETEVGLCSPCHQALTA